MLIWRLRSRYVIVLCVLIAILFFRNALWNEQARSLSLKRSSYDWARSSPHYPIPVLTPLPSGKPHQLRSVQYEFSKEQRSDTPTQKYRREAVKEVFQKCWNSYKTYAWLKDELEPVTGQGKNTFGGWAATLIDSLDTLWIMGLKEEFWEAAQAAVDIDWAKTPDTACNLFETNIRHLGGLLSAYDLSRAPALLEKATELGNMLQFGFDTPNHMPPFWLDFQKARQGMLVADDREPSAAVGSLSLEFTRLSQLTGDNRYYDGIARITNLLHRNQNYTKLPGMWPTFFNMKDATVVYDNTFTLGALADSLYEYLPKMYALLGGLEEMYESMWTLAANTIEEHVLFHPMTPDNADILFAGTVYVNDEVILDPEGQHLGCFAGGLFALGGKLFNNSNHVDIGIKLARGCAWAYQSFPTGIMPEIFSMTTCPSLDGCPWDEERWRMEVANDIWGHDTLPKGFRNARDPRYILRPEAIESVFLLYRMTGLEEFRNVAWQMFLAITAATETLYGNSAIANVTALTTPHRMNSMESFWMAETLKYFYLIFSTPDVINLNDWVFNTEAHPFRLPKR